MQEYFDKLLNTLKKQNIKGRSSSLSHLKSAIYDWNIERNWNNERAEIINIEDKGFAFITFTKREPRHCSLRHIFVLEEYRGQNIGRAIMNKLYDNMKTRNINILRFFVDIPSIDFYKKIGYNNFHGLSKTGLPFYYGDCQGNLIQLPKSQIRYVKKEM